jgi:hypothetical protein
VPVVASTRTSTRCGGCACDVGSGGEAITRTARPSPWSTASERSSQGDNAVNLMEAWTSAASGPASTTSATRTSESPPCVRSGRSGWHRTSSRPAADTTTGTDAVAPPFAADAATPRTAPAATEPPRDTVAVTWPVPESGVTVTPAGGARVRATLAGWVRPSALTANARTVKEAGWSMVSCAVESWRT